VAICPPFITQQNDNKFGNLDGDEFTDQVFHILGVGFFIFESNPSTTNFDSIYFYDYTSINQEFAGFTIGDFDQDSRTEFFTGSTHGDVLCIENSGNNTYTQTWTGLVETNNAYRLAQTNDVDGNGKKEIWVGGDSFYPEIGAMTRITIFESDGDDTYQIVGRIDLVGVFSFFAQNYQAVDVDKDGIEEMMVCIEQTVLILKFNGSQNHQSYELFYFKQNDLALAGRNSVYYGTVIYDLKNDGKEEIIITLDDIIENVSLRIFSFIYKPEFTIDVNDGTPYFPTQFNLYPNYPNPFNPNTQINYSIKSTGLATMKVYDLLGTEVATLVNEIKEAGSYSVNFNASNLPSGIYIYRLIADNFVDSKKLILMK
jgi:hypothetical protein